MKVFIDSSCDIQYASFYIQGLYEVFGKKNVKFSSQHFKRFRHQNHFFAFIISKPDSLKKIIIDFTDSSLIDGEALKWCDVYGKINLDTSVEIDPKISPIGPSFGIQIYSRIETLWYAFINLYKAYKQIPDKHKFLADYKAQFSRPKLSDYQSRPTSNDYVFFMASLWKREARTNTLRANFITSCRQHDQIQFEGGFAPRTKKDIQGFETLTTERRISMASYLNKIKKTVFVFNTPAVKDCHGWKLAEYLCLGKAIISTRLLRELPAKLESSKEVLFTNGDITDITAKINLLLDDKSLRRSLEQGAKKYFDTYLTPYQVIKRLID